MTANAGAEGLEQGATVLVADDHGCLAEAMALVLRAKGLTATFTTDLGEHALVRAVDRVRPSVVLLDLYDGAGGSTTIGTISSITRRGARVVVLTGSGRRGDAAAARAAGASAVVGKGGPLSSTLDAVVAAVRAPEPCDTPSVERRRAERDVAVERLSVLSPRQREVLLALARGRTAVEIAAWEQLSVATVRSHVHAVLTTLGLHSQLGAVALVYQAGWLEA